ncbi:folylpolyglutamate synthase-like isoform X2 [Magnolia sinica]|uniref:folylpolyglutamate synthase-like isoform X2 n=1 Tax=Magnolia sinica TaxID=86752 RepID=UPI002659835E|nr:folylpolyglutamate synthase-like isoform X2 [Magnolia sinica]
MASKGRSQETCLSDSYEAAMEALSSLITRRKRGDGSNRVEKFSLMFKYMKVLDLEEHIAGLKIIHIAGTKGKGSTCTFSEAILRECGFQTGLFTSPHLVDVRERYRIDGVNISEDKFLQHFWDCWNQLKEKVTDDLPMPPLFQFLTLLAFKIFISEKVDVAILEVGLGGRLDSTNVVKEPVVCGITSLGMDHMEILGDTLGKIASEKAGIFKIPLKVASPLDRGKLGGLELGMAGDHQFINAGLAIALCRCWLQQTGHSKVLFRNENQESDLPEAFLKGLSTANLPGRAQVVYDISVKSYESEVNETSSGDLIFYLDGAHSPESMEVCARWFSNAVKEDVHSSKNGMTEHDDKNFDRSNKISKQILLFNCMEVRDPLLLLPRLVNTCASSGVHFSKALFVPSISTYHKVDSAASIALETTKDLSWQSTLQRTWEKIIHGKGAISEESSNFDNPETLPSSGFLYGDPYHKCNPVNKQFTCSAVIPSLPSTIKLLRDCVKENPSIRLQVLVTGSLHLVGDVLKLLRR